MSLVLFVELPKTKLDDFTLYNQCYRRADKPLLFLHDTKEVAARGSIIYAIAYSYDEHSLAPIVCALTFNASECIVEFNAISI
jgi:hypothetical protein